MTLYVPGEPVQERADEDELPKVRVDGLSVQVRPVEGEVEEVSETIPDRPLTLVMINVEAPVAPVMMVTLDGLAVNARSWTVKVTGTECEREPVAAVTMIE